MVKVAVTGGRDYGRKRRAWDVLDAARDRLGLTCGVDGHAPGLDLYARQWGAARGVPWVSIKAQWHRYGRAAGPIRNQFILDHERPDVMLAFPGGDGTQDMVDRVKLAIERGVAIRLIEIDRA